jgi:hypothetical protein
MMMPINTVGGPSASEVIQQAFCPAIAVLSSPDVDVSVEGKTHILVPVS